ncbi:MAG: hypothetical protein IKY89_08000 [Alistipes sp.]|nr:hypothetical protein [Alistipes sp.]
MKNLFKIMVACIAIVLLFSCEKESFGRSNKLAGQTFVYSNGYSGSMKIEEGYKFKSSGGVFHYSEVGYSSTFDTDGCSLYYTLDGNNITIYYGTKGWKKEKRHTVYAAGQYHGDHITINGKDFYKR